MRFSTALFAVLLLITAPALPQVKRSTEPIEKTGLLETLKEKAVRGKVLVGQIRRRGVSFQITPENEQEIRSAGKYLGTSGLNDLIVAIRSNYRAPKLPDVGLRFVSPKGPTVVIENRSDVVAREIKWGIALWDLEKPTDFQPIISMFRSFDWLKPHGYSGPTDFTMAVESRLRPGMTLIGTAMVNCPECPKGRTYLLHIVWREGGWYAEAQAEGSGDLLIPDTKPPATLEHYLGYINVHIPEKARIPIAETSRGNTSIDTNNNAPAVPSSSSIVKQREPEIVLLAPPNQDEHISGYKWLPLKGLALDIVKPPVFRLKNLSNELATGLEIIWRIVEAPPIRVVFLNSEHFKRYHAEIESGFAPFHLRSDKGGGVGMTVADEETTHIAYLREDEVDVPLPSSISTSHGLRLVGTSIRLNPANQPQTGGGSITTPAPLIDVILKYKVAGNSYTRHFRIESTAYLLSDTAIMGGFTEPQSIEPQFWSPDNFRAPIKFSVKSKD